MAILTDEERAGIAQVLRAAEKLVFADGRVDIAEAKSLIGLVDPYVGKDADLALFRKLLVDVAEDGVVTPEESRAIAACLARLVEKFVSTREGIYDARTLGYPKMGLLGVQHLFCRSPRRSSSRAWARSSSTSSRRARRRRSSARPSRSCPATSRSRT